MKLELHRLPGTFAVHRLPSDAPLPAGLNDEPFYALLRSRDELSVCCHADFELGSERVESGWACLMVAGPLDFSLTGVVSGLTAPLAAAGIPVFVMSSFDTDYLLLKEEVLSPARAVLGAHGIDILSE